MKQFLSVTLALVALCAGLEAQNRTRFGGETAALDYAYGILPNTPAALQVSTGNTTTTGTGTVTLVTAATTLGDGRVIFPLATNAPITIDAGSNQETVTPSSLSNCAANLGLYTCQVSASFTKTHGTGSLITSGTVGLQEAINSGGGTGGGGVVLVDSSWTANGGTTAMLSAAAPYSNVSIKDNRATAVNPYWSMQPTTLTVLAVPTTLTATNIVFTAATGTWAASSTHFTATCVDALGGESAASADYTQTPTLNYTLTVPVPPTCATGAVGWRLYAGTSSAATSYLLPASGCATQSALVSTIAACGPTSTGTWAATFTTTTNLAPVALGVTNTSNPVPAGHTTFGYQPTGSLPQVFQTEYGPFGSGTIASATASDLTPLGSFNLPAGFQNTIGRTIRVSGRILLTAGASSTLGITIGTVWAGGVTAGAPITVCNPISGFVWATHAYTSVNFSCTMTTNAVGATAVGSIMPDSMFMGGYAAGTLIPVGTDNANAAIGSLGLFAQNEYTIFLAPLVAADTTVQLQSLHIEPLN